MQVYHVLAHPHGRFSTDFAIVGRIFRLGKYITFVNVVEAIACAQASMLLLCLPLTLVDDVHGFTTCEGLLGQAYADASRRYVRQRSLLFTRNVQLLTKTRRLLLSCRVSVRRGDVRRMLLHYSSLGFDNRFRRHQQCARISLKRLRMAKLLVRFMMTVNV